MTLAVTHSTAADGTFSTAGATAWDASHALAGVADVSQGGTGNASWTAGRILYASGTTTLTQSANLTWDITNSNLIIGGAPTGAATTDKLQVNGTALLNELRVSKDTSYVHVKSIVPSRTLQFETAAVTSGMGSDIVFYPGNSSDATNAAGSFNALGGNNTASGGIGGSVYFTAGRATGAGGVGGDILFNAGPGLLGATPGNTYFGSPNSAHNWITLNDTGIGFYDNAPVAQVTYGAVSGALDRTAFNSGTATVAQVAQHLAALLTDLKALGLIA